MPFLLKALLYGLMVYLVVIIIGVILAAFTPVGGVIEGIAWLVGLVAAILYFFGYRV
jgi:hypothetical protein